MLCQCNIRLLDEFVPVNANMKEKSVCVYILQAWLKLLQNISKYVHFLLLNVFLMILCSPVTHQNKKGESIQSVLAGFLEHLTLFSSSY